MGKQTAKSARLFTFFRRGSELGIAERHVSGSGRRVPSDVEIISVVIMATGSVQGCQAEEYHRYNRFEVDSNLLQGKFLAVVCL